MLSFVFLFSCSKDQQEIVSDQPVDLNQQELLSKMKEASMVIAQFAENEDVQKELDQMIKLKMYNDDFVFFKDLFSPSSNEKLKSANIETTAFEKAFNNAVTSTGLKSGEINDLKDYLTSNNLVLYIPYPIEMYPDKKQVPTISFHPLVNDSINEGVQAIIENNKVKGYKNVTVDDAYALKNLCYLIVPAMELSYESEDAKAKSAENVSAGYHYEIRIKLSRCFKQYDGIFAGGSEIYFGNGEPAIANGHVTAPPKGFSHSFSRSEILWNTLKNINTLFIADWSEDKTQIVMFVYEDDNEGSVEVAGTAKITHTSALADTTSSVKTSTGWETGVSVKTTYKSQDCVIFNNDYPRDWFFNTNYNGAGEWGHSLDGLTVRGAKDALEYTMSITTRYY